ncbi:dienelactone hydrolase family protein [Paracoccus rhizosphaerae]|uniref:Dienelactone hydrolase family protein n=1 Tax=Paracoccus rhizosphaerae TaxID=1133347 RepID=A0ABV6CPA4_9RHOB|nr:dienelactone hydrolase family protein [Paracoccus rhizosphaerae]
MQKIKITGPNPLLIGDMADSDGVPTIDIEAELYLPRGRIGRCPAVVISEGLGGLQDRRERDYGRMLSNEGYVVLVIDSFGSRGVGGNGDFVRAMTVTEAMMLADAFTGLRFLAVREDVDVSRTGIIGFSYGGMITQLAAYEQLARLFLPDGLRFATHVSYYGCSIPRLDNPTTSGAPVTILLGEKDRNVSIPRVQDIAADLRRGGSDTSVISYDGIYHQWDGTDEKPRWVPANLRHLHLRVGQDQSIRDENGFMQMKGRWSRRALIARHTDPRGYHILRDRPTTARTNNVLLQRLQSM